MLLKTVFVNTF